jgi:polysaccharide export outer membrane protein
VPARFPSIGKLIVSAIMMAGLSACSTLGASGPSTGSVRDAGASDYRDNGIAVVELDGGVLGRLKQHGRSSEFSEVFAQPQTFEEVVGYGDVLDIAIWEAPPAVLFGATSTDLRLTANPQVAQSASIPQQRVGNDGTVSVPFVGEVKVVGRKPADIERAIIADLNSRAHDPQVIVRLVQNRAQAVTVLGEVAQSSRLPLTATGERLLDAVASAGGTRQPVERTIVQLTRGERVASMPLQRVIDDPAQNVRLAPDDVITILHQPFSFVALGAVSRSAEVPFDGSGVSLAEALGRVGGLNDRRADVRGVFVFRLEDSHALGTDLGADALQISDGRVPVIYRLDLSNPSSLFAMQDFAIRDDDVIYVSAAPGSDLQRFISTISSAAFSVIGITNALQSNGN